MQVVSFIVAALYSGIRCWRWVRSAGDERMMWGQLGLFSGMVCLGSVAGAVAWSAAMQKNSFFYEASAPGVTRQQTYMRFASTLRFGAVLLILNGFEFLFLIISKLMLLGWLVENATQSSQENVEGMSGVRRRWLNGRALPFVYRMMTGGVVVGCVLGLVADAAAGAYLVKEAVLFDQAAASCDAAGNESNASLTFNNAASAVATEAATSQSVQAGSEALTLLLVCIAYFVIVSWSVAIFRIVERVAGHALVFTVDPVNVQQPDDNAARIVADTMKAAAQHRRRLTAACVIVLITFPARAAFNLLLAYAAFDDSYNTSCGPCDPCQTTPFLISAWLDYTPQFQPIVVAVSSPLPLMLSIWLLTKVHARARLIAADVQRSRVGDVL